MNAANVINYKSNDRVFKKNYFRYQWDEHSHYKLDYRIVIECLGGLDARNYCGARGGLSEGSANFLDDAITLNCSIAIRLFVFWKNTSTTYSRESLTNDGRKSSCFSDYVY